jgi:hypothetical protein
VRTKNGRRTVAAAVLFSGTLLVTGTALPQPMGSSLPGSSASPPPAPAAPGSSLGVDNISAGKRRLAAEKCIKLSGEQKEKCLRDARLADEPDPAAVSQEGKGSTDRVGPASTGMGSGAGGSR